MGAVPVVGSHALGYARNAQGWVRHSVRRSGSSRVLTQGMSDIIIKHRVTPRMVRLRVRLGVG